MPSFKKRFAIRPKLLPRLLENVAVRFLVIVCLMWIGLHAVNVPESNSDDSGSGPDEVEKRLEVANVQLEEPPAEVDSTVSPSSLGFDRVFVLSLARRKDRQEYVRKVASDWGIDFEFSFGVSGTDDAQIELYKSHVLPIASLTRGEISTYASHYQLSQLIRQREYEHALILEDDVIVGKEVTSAPVLHSLLKRVHEALKHKNYDVIDVIYFGHCYGREDLQHSVENITIESSPTWTIRNESICACGHAYAVSRRGAEKILRGLATLNKAWDMVLRDNVEWGIINAYAIWPPIFNQLWQLTDLEVTPDNMRLLCSDGKYLRDTRCPMTDGQITTPPDTHLMQKVTIPADT
eukprot:CAMPEP_0184676254 /NCGR_PEP_ID=MMETSP0308-20130426/88252_1 /TAXON_ID=38269 /ORGANISM="Gloeochaete witrockiana, Strain SAG 46.84" /LENGTH=349 /DNA_ID=CAMNT_0027124073 /DNA_START=44 /DNA_END=1093 /DNA_ORIENTATION=-